ncbi:MAG TPA: hypothetical protein VIU42_10705 [Xanthobacteraceae bacterium]|jgi:hypothetical protein
MKKIREYREHAAECRDMARVASAGHRTQLEQMAATWDQLAEARARQLAKDGKTEEEDDGRPDEITSAGSDPRER